MCMQNLIAIFSSSNMLNSVVLKYYKLACNSGVRSLIHTRRSVKLTEQGRLRERASVEVQAQTKAKNVQSLQKSAGEFVAESGVPFKGDRTPTEIIIKAGAFAVGFTGCCFVGCSLWKQNNDRLSLQSGIVIGPHRPNIYDIKDQLHKPPMKHTGSLREQCVEWWRQQSAGHKWFASIAALNMLVFAGWKVKVLQKTFLRFFACSAFSKSLLSPMVLSAFSHQRPLHLLINMYVLHSFGIVVCDQVTGYEQITFLYLTGAVWGSLAGLAHKAITRNPVFAVGASGAVLALLGYTCCRLENARLSIVFLPMFTFSAQSALMGVALLDICGLVFRWRMMDHACHLGGLFFGIWYANYGEKWLWNEKRLVLNRWFRSRFGDV